MKLALRWNGKMILKEDKTIGYFVNNNYPDCNYQLFEKQLKFKSIGNKRNTISIMDEENNIIGMIYNSRWFKGARIILQEIEYDLKPVNFFNRKWKLYSSKNELIEFQKGLFSQGKINSVFQDEQLILASLFALTKRN